MGNIPGASRRGSVTTAQRTMHHLYETILDRGSVTHDLKDQIHSILIARVRRRGRSKMSRATMVAGDPATIDCSCRHKPCEICGWQSRRGWCACGGRSRRSSIRRGYRCSGIWRAAPSSSVWGVTPPSTIQPQERVDRWEKRARLFPRALTIRIRNQSCYRGTGSARVHWHLTKVAAGPRLEKGARRCVQVLSRRAKHVVDDRRRRIRGGRGSLDACGAAPQSSAAALRRVLFLLTAIRARAPTGVLTAGALALQYSGARCRERQRRFWCDGDEPLSHSI
jgi:hypothetical protein